MAEEGMKVGNINEIAAAIGKSVADNMAAGTANADVLAKETGREEAKERQEFKDILLGIHKSIDSSFSSSKDTNTKTGGLLAGLFGGMGSAGLGGLGKAVANIGKGFGIGLAALGAGIAGFLLAIGGVMVIFDLIGPDGSALKHVVHTFFGAFDAKAATLMGGIIAIAAVMSKFQVSKKQFMKAMTAIGAGIGGFFAGILLGDLAASIGESVGLNGESLAKLMKTFFGAFDGIGAVLILGLSAIAGAVAQVPGSDPKKIMSGMFALGAGLGGFFGGVLLADIVAIAGEAIGIDGTTLAKLMSNFFGAFEGLAGTATLIALLGAGAVVGLAPNKGIAKKIMTGMFAIGAGLGGFFGGIILADIAANMMMAVGFDGKNIATLMQSFIQSFSGVDEGALMVMGGLLAIGAIMGAKLKAAQLVRVPLGMGALGAGIAGFFGGLSIADAVLTTIADWTAPKVSDGSILSGFIQNFSLALDSMTEKSLMILGGLLAAGATIGALLSPAKILKVPLGMIALGAGIAGFFGGLSLAETLMTKVADWTGGKVSDGSVLSTFLGNFATALDGMSDKSLKILGGMLVAGAAIGVLLPGVGPLGVALGMTALGAGLAGFFAGLSMADFVASKAGTGENLKQLMTNLGEGIGGFIGGIAGGAMKGFLELDADKLSQVGAGVKDLGMGMLAFAGGTAGGAVAGVMEGIAGFFGADSPLEKIEDFVDDFSDKDAKRLTTIGKGMLDLGMGFAALGGVDATKVNANLASMQGLDLEQLMAKAKTENDRHEGGLIKRGGNYSLMAGEAVLTPAQLTNMANTMELLVGSRNIEAGKNGGAPIVVNNIDQSQQTQTNMNRTQNVNVGSDSPHNQNSTLSRLN